MADSIQFRRGLRSTVKPLPVGMPGFVEDEERLVIGKGDGTNAELPNKADMDNVNSHLADKALDLEQRMINVRQPPYNAKGNKVDDDTAIIEQALADAVTKGTKVVYAPRGFYRTTRKITIPEGVIFVGEEGITTAKWIPSRTDTNGKDGGRPSDLLKGSWIFYDGDKLDNVFEVLEGGSLANFGFWYMGNSWDNWTLKSEVYPYGVGYPLYQPIDYAPAIVSSAKELRLQSLFFINAYEAIRIVTGENIFLEDIKINNIHMGINVLKSSAHLVFNKIDIYPYWSRAYDYQGDSMRPNLYNEVYGTGIKTGDSAGGTLEQVLMTNIDVFGPADAIILGGKGVQGTNIKVDNSFRSMTIESWNNSSLHNLSNLWLSSFVSQSYSSPTAITDGTVYALEVRAGGSLNITNLQIPRADGVGVNIRRSDYATNLKSINIENCRYKGLIVGDALTGMYRMGIEDVSVYCVDASVIPFEINNLVYSKVKGLKYAGTKPTVKLNWNVSFKTNSIDLSALELDNVNNMNGNLNIQSDDHNTMTTRTQYAQEDLTEYVFLKASKDRAGVNSAQFTASVSNQNNTGNSGAIAKFKVRRPSSPEQDTYLALDAQNGAVYSDFDNLINFGLSSKRWKEVFAVNVSANGYKLTAIGASSAPNNSMFVDSADNKLKFKDSAGVVNLLY